MREREREREKKKEDQKNFFDKADMAKWTPSGVLSRLRDILPPTFFILFYSYFSMDT